MKTIDCSKWESAFQEQMEAEPNADEALSVSFRGQYEQ